MKWEMQQILGGSSGPNRRGDDPLTTGRTGGKNQECLKDPQLQGPFTILLKSDTPGTAQVHSESGKHLFLLIFWGLTRGQGEISAEFQQNHPICMQSPSCGPSDPQAREQPLPQSSPP